MVCYSAGTIEISRNDVNAMRCIINFHHRQNSRCIDIEGSVCGRCYRGSLLRGQISYVTGPYNISAEWSSTLQAAAESMNGIKIDYKKISNAPIQLAIVLDANGLQMLNIQFDGHNGKDC